MTSPPTDPTVATVEDNSVLTSPNSLTQDNATNANTNATTVVNVLRFLTIISRILAGFASFVSLLFLRALDRRGRGLRLGIISIPG